MESDRTRRDAMATPSVIVVGAGPTGLMLAVELALAGISCRILERRAEESNLTRAFGVHARTLEVLDMRGMADELISQGLRVPEVRPHLGKIGLRLDLNHPESRFPYVLIVPQARTEKLLEARAHALGVEIVRGAEVVGLYQDETGVELTVNGSDGTRSEWADYVVGCDGAHSTVRRLLGVGFVGESYDTHIMLADVRLSEELPTAVNAYVSRDGVVVLPAFGDGWYRAVIWDRRREHVPLNEPLGLDEVRGSFRRIAGTDFSMREMRWSTRFLSERRQAEHYRVGCVFLAGDAAHVHSPLGALGMNTGIQDAINLGWKLAANIHGWAPPWLLDTYQTERHPVGRDTLRVTDLLQRVVVASPLMRAVRPLLARFVLRFGPVQGALRRRISGLSIAYPPQRGERAHPWTGQRIPDIAVDGSRLYELMRDGRFVLLDRTANGDAAHAAEKGWSDRVNVLRVTAATAPKWPAVTLIRPDGYAAWASNASALDERLSTGCAALHHWCGPTIAHPNEHAPGARIHQRAEPDSHNDADVP
jgi:2-polyprenyl-6-methoxyphenol hydroxylase-like FAD-dependent oxidoreductase